MQATICCSIRFLSIKKIKNILQNKIEEHNNQFNTNSYPQFLSIEPSSICNLRCPQCMIGNRMTERNSNFFPIELYKKVIDECKDTLIDVQLFFQGEPLTHNKIDEFVKYAYHNKIATIISTNAMLLNDEMAQKLIDSKLTKLIVSIDGTQQSSYEKYRVGGNLSKVISNVTNLIKRKKENKSIFPIIETQMIVFQHNEAEIHDFIEISKHLGADIITLKTAQIDNPNKTPELIPTNEKFSRYQFNNRVGKWQLKNKTQNRCQRIFNGMVITSDGKAVPCCFDKVPNYIVGDINSESIKEIFQSKKIANFRQQIYTNRNQIKMCNNCNE